jgi:hypothetical protein
VDQQVAFDWIYLVRDQCSLNDKRIGLFGLDPISTKAPFMYFVQVHPYHCTLAEPASLSELS